MKSNQEQLDHHQQQENLHTTVALPPSLSFPLHFLSCLSTLSPNEVLHAEHLPLLKALPQDPKDVAPVTALQGGVRDLLRI